ncbi:MAG: DUF4124 domain-containing protein [Desulfobulbaceae bacterium]|nr:DUF4124 domain-containing protein [Desulfobulbaceae bacterium]
MFLRNLRLVAAATVGLLLLSGNASATTIYTFVDEQGVVHLTNVPSDSRYQPTTRFSFPEVRGRGQRHQRGLSSPLSGRRAVALPSTRCW